MHIYIGHAWSGTPSETDEITPTWFCQAQIPYHLMFPDAAYWLPMVLKGKKIKAHFQYDEQWNILSKSIKR